MLAVHRAEGPKQRELRVGRDEDAVERVHAHLDVLAAVLGAASEIGSSLAQQLADAQVVDLTGGDLGRRHLHHQRDIALAVVQHRARQGLQRGRHVEPDAVLARLKFRHPAVLERKLGVARLDVDRRTDLIEERLRGHSVNREGQRCATAASLGRAQGEPAGEGLARHGPAPGAVGEGRGGGGQQLLGARGGRSRVSSKEARRIRAQRHCDRPHVEAGQLPLRRADGRVVVEGAARALGLHGDGAVAGHRQARVLGRVLRHPQRPHQGIAQVGLVELQRHGQRAPAQPQVERGQEVGRPYAAAAQLVGGGDRGVGVVAVQRPRQVGIRRQHGRGDLDGDIAAGEDEACLDHRREARLQGLAGPVLRTAAQPHAAHADAGVDAAVKGVGVPLRAGQRASSQQHQ